MKRHTDSDNNDNDNNTPLVTKNIGVVSSELYPCLIGRRNCYILTDSLSRKVVSIKLLMIVTPYHLNPLYESQ